MINKIAPTIADALAEFRPGVEALIKGLGQALPESDRTTLEATAKAMTDAGVPGELAHAVARLDWLAAAKPDVVAANLNPAVSPGDDFFEYANGGWLKRNPIPASESRWDIGRLVREQLYASLRKINEQGAAAPEGDGGAGAPGAGSAGGNGPAGDAGDVIDAEVVDDKK